MSQFDLYSKYYDLLYRDKNYAQEADYVMRLIRKNNPAAKSVLNIGCGTGGHDGLFLKAGYALTGVDLSDTMLESARLKNPTAEYYLGDARACRLAQKFDAVISLFHVMSYQCSNTNLADAFETAHYHCKPGGFFIFDCWYGPAVLTDRPVVRIKRMSDETIDVIRLAEPAMKPNDNVVQVCYEVHITDKKNGGVQKISEIHPMRYLFKPEIEAFLNQAGFNLVHSEEWLTGKMLGFDTWSALFVAKSAA